MRSSRIAFPRAVLFLAAMSLSACGVFGDKAAAIRNLAYKSDQMGCLNGFA